jgi:hypothetical protein
MDRLEALEKKSKTYNSTEPCLNCGNNLRFTWSRACVACHTKRISRSGSPRNLAKAAGQITYQTGKPCKHGHNAPRFTSTGGCTLCTNPKSPYVSVRVRVHISDVPKLEAYATALRLTRPPLDSDK